MNELESSAIIDNPHPDKPQEDIAAISELISRGDAPESEQQDAPEAPERDDQPPEMAEQGSDEIAPQEEADEPEAPQVDYDQVIPMPDGLEPVTVGQLKDHYREHQDLQQERETWEAHQSEQQLKLMAVQRDVEQLLQFMRTQPPEVLAHLQRLRAVDTDREKAMLLQVFPDWADAEKKKAARAEQLETFQQYGFSEQEYSGIQDHRVIKALHDLTQYRKREAAAKAKAEQLKAELPKGQKTVQRKQTPAQQRAALINRAKRGDQNAKIAAISSLISEG